MVAAIADDTLAFEATDLDDLPAADDDHDINYFYGRLAAFDTVLSS